MSDMILWRKLTRTDMMAITGEAAPSGTGGGAKHIALGVSTRELPLLEFFSVPHCQDVGIVIEEVPGLIVQREITFSCNPARRGGEWRISQQHLDRYPLWYSTFGFPSSKNEYNADDPPIIFVIRISGTYHARFCMYSELADVSPLLLRAIDAATKNTGIESYETSMGSLFGLRIPPAVNDERITASGTDSSTLPPPPARVSTPVTRYIRDSRFGRELKKLYDYKCCFCEAPITRPHDNPYVESCHIRPMNNDGPDVKENLLILCPNHHVELDYGTISIDPKTMTLKHIDVSNGLHGQPLILKHEVAVEYLEYHFTRFSNRTLMGY